MEVEKMRPIRLKIQGLNSFVEEQIICFDTLVSKGFFGIFGPTGSGKSTILDAMIVALYGKIPRDTREFINTECEELSVSYEFMLHRGDGPKSYVVERNFKRDQQSYRTTLARLYERPTEGKLMIISEGPRLVEKSIQDLIGLTMDDFTRSVVLPQGKFSDFLKLTGGERRNMLERLFGLEEYGQLLREKIRRTKRAHQDEMLLNEGQLSQYQNISTQMHQQMVEEYTQLQDQRKKLQKRWAQYQVQYELWKKQWQTQQEYLSWKEQEERHHQRTEEIQILKEKVHRAKVARQLLPFVKELQDTENKVQGITQQLEREDKIVKQLKESLVQTEAQYAEALKNKNHQYPLLLEQQKDLQRAIQLQEEFATIEGERLLLGQAYKKIQHQLLTLEEEQKQEDRKQEEKEKEHQDIEIRKRKMTIAPRIREQIYEGVEIEKQFLEQEQKEKQLKERYLSYQSKKIKTKKLYDDQQKKQKEALQKLKELENIQAALDEKKPPTQGEAYAIALLRAQLKEGEPCLVCGSHIHETSLSKRVIEGSNIDLCKQQEAENTLLEMQVAQSDWENKNRKSQEQIQKKREEIHAIETQMAILKERVDQETKQEEDAQKEWEMETEELQNKQKVYEAQKIELGLNSIAEKFKEIRKWDQELAKLQEEEEKVKKEIRAYQIKREERNQSTAKLREERREVEVLGQEKRQRLDRLQEEIKQYAENREPKLYLEEVTHQLTQILDKEEKLRGKKEELQTRGQQKVEEQMILKQKYISLMESKEKQIVILQSQMEQTMFTTVHEIIDSQCVMDQQEKWEQEIQSYEEKIQKIKYHIETLGQQLEATWLEEKMWNSFQQEKNETEKLLENKLEEVAIAQNQLEQIVEKLKTQKDLLKKKKELDYRSGLLEDLDRLVQGNRFVEFISMYQLQYIVKEATKTLKQMTRGRYALELDDEGNFIMRDDFNGGNRRNANTLSGGETFLTSLALALALSSQVQLKNKAPLEIFFLDEGFGTLDPDLLDIVMGALERLQSQKLVIGIISHVEELKNRVPGRIIVEPPKQGESGTKIRVE